jgi:hypothetical protein
MADVIVIRDTQLFDPYIARQTTSDSSSEGSSSASERTARSFGGKRMVQRVFLKCIDQYKEDCVCWEDCVIENGAFKFWEPYCLRCGSELILKTEYTEHDDAADATDVDSNATDVLFGLEE